MSFFAEKVLPKTIVDEERKGEKRVIIGNAGSLRFDLVSLLLQQLGESAKLMMTVQGCI